MTVLEAIGQAYQNGYANGYEAGKKDAVEVVRCKDCKNYDDEGYCWFWKYETGMSPNEVDVDDFCSYGERRTE